MFVNCHSYHSLRYGTIPVEELVALGAAHGAAAMALTDINAIAGVYDFIKACRAQGIHPVPGMEFQEEGQLLYIALARNRTGFGEICRLRSEHNLKAMLLPESAPASEHVFYIYPMQYCPDDLGEHEYIGVRPEQANRLLLPQWQSRLHKMLVWQPVTIRHRKDYQLHQVLRAIDLNTLVSKLKPEDCCSASDQMLSEQAIREAFTHFPEIPERTQALLMSCRFEMDFKTLKNKKCYTNNRKSDRQLLTRLALDGFQKRYPPDHSIARQRVMRELDIIDQLGFSGYFLITWDIIRYSESRGFMHVGRGSGANSIVSYCLGITDICPIELNLYFERFLNPARTSPPDFDIDWSWQDRDEILRYIFERFGPEHVAFCGTNVEFKYKSIIREIGKAFGLPKEELDALTRTPPSRHDSNRVVRQIHEYGQMLEKFPNQRSMHACGILISEEPITQYSALELPPKGFPVVQFDMHVAEEIGFEKFDILSQRGIGHINDCVQLILRNRGERVDIRNISLSKNHPACNEFLKLGKTLGCFYIESPAMRGLLRKLQCDNYITLVAASSIIRPGVAKSGMMSEFVFRHNFPDQFEFFHPVFEDQLAETYGIMVYQEDVIKIAHHFAGLDLADADILRRAMSGKTRSKKEFEGVRQRFFDNCRAMGHPEELAQEVYRQIESFAGYSFCKAHSASYAVESYQSLYLKVHYPVEFMVAVINNFGGFYRTEVYVHEAKMSGAVVHNPCVNRSEYLTTLYGKDVFLGFVHLKSLEESTGHAIVAERKRRGDFRSLEDFVRRISIGPEALQLLIQIGAFRFTGKPKNELMLLGRTLLSGQSSGTHEVLLFEEPIAEYVLPALERSPFEDAFDEIELLGFPVSCSPFDLLKTRYRGDVLQPQLLEHASKIVRMVGYLVSIKHVPTKRGMMNFGTWFDVEGHHFDTAHFADSLAEYSFQGSGCYLIQGIVQCDYNFATVVVQKMAKLPFIPDPRYEDEKDFRFKVYGQMKEDISITHRAPYPGVKEIGLPRGRMM